mgnify:CR=1 FL=1
MALVALLRGDNVGCHRSFRPAVLAIDRLFGVPATTRNWNAITAIARVLENGQM